MAVFERQYEREYPIDDTQEIKCVIETAQEVNGHTEYVLRLHRGLQHDNCWRILRRYNEFEKLHKSLFASGIELPLPKKRLIGNMRPDFIAERRQALQVYINAVLMNPILASSLTTKRFVDPDSYSQSFHDQALQNASLCLRSEALWALGASCGAIGWRLRKHYFKVTSKPHDKASNRLLVKSGSNAQSKDGSSPGSSGGSSATSPAEPNELVLEWLEYGPEKFIEEKELAGILKSLVGLRHPYIETIVSTGHNENGCMVIRKFYKQGTLKDYLCSSPSPRNTFLSKYGNPKVRKTMTVKQIATYGLQILDALIFLHSKGFPYGHLHSGNIVINEDSVKLLDVENFVLGVPAFYRPFFVQHSKIHSVETIDVYCYGHILFEMAMGYPLQESVVRQINDCCEPLKNLLEIILSKDACRAGLPTLDQIRQHHFFQQYASVPSKSSSDEGDKPNFKLSSSAKEAIRNAIQRSENRLHDEQKSVKNQKRIVRVQELMSSEEERRKLKQKTRLEHKQSKLKQQNSLQQASNGRLSLVSVSSSPGMHTDHAFSVKREASQDSPNAHISPIDIPPLLQQQPLSPAPTSGPSVERQHSSPNFHSDSHGGGEEEERSALLESICKFNRGSLRKVHSND